MPVLVLDWNGLLAAKVRSNAGTLVKIVLRNDISELVGVLAGSYNLVLWSCGGHNGMIDQYQMHFLAIVTGCECKLPRHSRDHYGRPLLVKPLEFLWEQLPDAVSSRFIFVDDSCEKIEENIDAVRLSVPNPFKPGMSETEVSRDTASLMAFVLQIAGQPKRRSTR